MNADLDTPERLRQAWQLTVAGEYEHAITIYTDVLEHLESMNARMNRGTAYLLNGHYKAAEEDFRKCRNHPEQLPAKLVNLQIGVALWLQDRREDACQDWANEITRSRKGDITHSDGVGAPALLWWASLHPGLEDWRVIAEEELKRRAKQKKGRFIAWPDPIIPYLLGESSEQDLRDVAQSASNPVVAQQRVCVASFYVGARLLSSGHPDIYRENLRIASGPGASIISNEYHLAAFECRRISNGTS
jgi:lipoprotein NlpI